MESPINEYKGFLNAVKIPLRLACTAGSGWPLVISLWYQYKDGSIYCATQKSAKIVSHLQNNPRCAFEIAEDRPPYCGVRGRAIASIDDQNGAEILSQLLERYLGGTDSRLAQTLLSKSQNEVAIVLKPSKIFTWDFSNRMQEIVSLPLNMIEKVCP
jgi:nitroimidazol reductase NimA-like FMN-containing flavoprotein (pyridoxamine 5'-phosphate oxidase superfamily)